MKRVAIVIAKVLAITAIVLLDVDVSIRLVERRRADALLRQHPDVAHRLRESSEHMPRWTNRTLMGFPEAIPAPDFAGDPSRAPRR